MVLPILWCHFKVAPFTQSDPRERHHRAEDEYPLPLQVGELIWSFTVRVQQMPAEHNYNDSRHILIKLKGTWWPLSVSCIYHILRPHISNRYPRNYYCTLYHLLVYRVPNLKYGHSDSKVSLPVCLPSIPSISMAKKNKNKNKTTTTTNKNQRARFPVWIWSYPDTQFQVCSQLKVTSCWGKL